MKHLQFLALSISLLASVATPATGFFERPRPDSITSGLYVFSGWDCEAEKVEIELNGILRAMSVKQPRGDTEAECGDADNGYSLLVNVSRFDDGEQTARLFIDDILARTRTYQVANFGENFLTDASGSYTLQNFPDDGDSLSLEWVEPQQNFFISGFTPNGASLNGSYTLQRFSQQNTAQDILDSEDPDVTISGTMSIAGNNMVQNINVQVGGVLTSTNFNGTIEDNGYFAVTTNLQGGVVSQLIIIERGNRFITSLHRSDIKGDFNEVNVWIRTSNPN